MTKSSVAVFGSSQAARESPEYGVARDLGAALARRGASIRCGGYGGIMEAVAVGAREAGGRVVGCTIDWFSNSREPCEQLDEVCEASDLGERIGNLLAGTRAAIVLPGGVGTFNELFWVWTLLMHGRPEGPDRLVLLGSHWEELLEFLGKRFEFPPALRQLVQIARDPEDAARAACGGGERTHVRIDDR